MSAQKSMFEINMDGWRMGDYSDFFAAGNRNDFEAQFEQMAKVVKAWPFAGAPNDAKAYRELSINEFQAVLKEIGTSITARFSRGN